MLKRLCYMLERREIYARSSASLNFVLFFEFKLYQN